VILRSRRLAALGIVAAAAMLPGAARATGPQLTAPVQGIDWAAGTVTVAAEYPAGTSTVVFSAKGEPLATVAVAGPAAAGTVSSGVPYRLAKATAFGAEFLDAQGASLGAATLELTPEMYTPPTPRLKLASGTIVGPSFKLDAATGRTATSAEVTAAPEPLARRVALSSAAGGRIELSRIRVPYGIEQLRLVASNGFGASFASAPRTVFSLGPPSRLPHRASYVLVDKRSMTLYDVHRNLVARHFDIAIGTPSTPTPDGYFKIGAPQKASGSWGVLRRPLYRFSRAKTWPTGFYIHGTDAPWDIGTWASHGCVRLYNWAIRRFAKTVPNGTLVLIRS